MNWARVLVSLPKTSSIGLDWQVAGFGNFSSNANETDMLMRNSKLARSRNGRRSSRSPVQSTAGSSVKSRTEH